MKLTIRRVKESVGVLVSLDIYINGKVCGKLAHSSVVEMNVDADEAEVFLKLNFAESNRISVSSDSKLRVYARGGLMGATFISLFRPKNAYVIEEDI